MHKYLVKSYIECFFFYIYANNMFCMCLLKKSSIARLSNIFQIIRPLVSMAQKLKLLMIYISFD
jgi:hypothetical protein